MTAKPKVLIVAYHPDWQGISRLPSGLDPAGISVTALCSPKSYLALSGYLEQTIFWQDWSKLIRYPAVIQIIQTIYRVKPDFVIPGDESTVVLLHQALKITATLPFLKLARAVLQRSLFKTEYLGCTISKENFINLASGLGVRVPQNRRISSESHALEIAKEIGYPVVIKCSVGAGGALVKICHQDTDIKEFIAQKTPKQPAKNWRNTLKAILSKLTPPIENSISIQEYISGRTSMFTFAAIEGKVLASVSIIKARQFPTETGPSSVIQTVESSELYDFARKIVAETGYNGFGAIEFILEKETNKPYAIEFNARPVPICHLGKHLGADLCKALSEYLQTDNYSEEQVQVMRNVTIALFPNEYRRDPNSSYLRECYHDVPTDEPKLMKALHQKYYEKFA
jgi:Carbamoyl-phosphate synthase L chain, ATP binding domain